MKPDSLSSSLLIEPKFVLSLDDLADLASDELVEIVGADAMDEDVANQVIMAARAHWFTDDAAPGEASHA